MHKLWRIITLNTCLETTAKRKEPINTFLAIGWERHLSARSKGGVIDVVSRQTTNFSIVQYIVSQRWHNAAEVIELYIAISI